MVVTTGEVLGHPQGTSQGWCHTPYRTHNTLNTQKKLSGQNIHSAEVEKLAKFRKIVMLEERKPTTGGARRHAFTKRWVKGWLCKQDHIKRNHYRARLTDGNKDDRIHLIAIT